MESIVVVVSYLVHYETLLQSETDNITKWDGYVITKYDKSSLQNVSDLLFQDATVLLQIVTVTRKCINFIAKCVPL